MQLPSDWEMLRFSRQFAKGRCHFFDRYQVRMEMNWQSVPGAPDTGRMLSDYTVKLQDQGVEGIEPIAVSGWHGLIGRQEGTVITRFGRYFESEGCLLELVFPWPGQRDRALEKQILQSVRAELPQADGQVRWRAFGMEVRVPADYELTSCTQDAGRTEFVFSPPKGFGERRFLRLGLIDNWLKGPVEQWLRTQKPRNVLVRKRETVSQGAYEEFRAYGRSKLWHRGIHLRKPYYAARAGICPNDGRLHFASCLSRERFTFPEATAPSVAARARVPATAVPVRETVQATGGEPWVNMLQAKPLQNKAAQVDWGFENVTVTVPRTKETHLKPPFSWIVPVSRERSTKLDKLGRQVWEQCNGRFTTEQIIDNFARTHALTFHEARVSVTGYLKGLIQRGILAVEVGGQQ
jgi:hypothetical protein